MGGCLKACLCVFAIDFALATTIALIDWAVTKYERLTNYPWAFRVINRCGVKIDDSRVVVEGAQNEVPVYGPIFEHYPNSLYLSRVKKLPKSFTVFWTLAGDSKERQQKVEFPQIAPGGDGVFFIEYTKDHRWVIYYDPDREHASDEAWAKTMESLRKSEDPKE